MLLHPRYLRRNQLWLAISIGFLMVLASVIALSTSRGDSAVSTRESGASAAASPTSEGQDEGGDIDASALDLPADQRAAWIETFNEMSNCMRALGYPRFPTAPSTFGDGKTAAPAIEVPSVGDSEADFSAALGQCPFHVSALDSRTFADASAAAVSKALDAQRTGSERVADSDDTVDRYVKAVEAEGEDFGTPTANRPFRAASPRCGISSDDRPTVEA